MTKSDEIKKAAKILAEGGIVALPTDTVYGVAANALDNRAVSKIYAAKGRPFEKPLAVFVKSLTEAEKFTLMTPLAKALAARFLPGPLTLILERTGGRLAENVNACGPTIGIRIPDHPKALELLAACSFPLAVTSANKSGGKSPALAEEVDIPVDFAIPGGKTPLGRESTVVDATGEFPKILRKGAIRKSDIESVLLP